MIGGLIYGPLVSRFAPEARGHGVPEVMYAVEPAGRADAPAGARSSSRSPRRCASARAARSGGRDRSCRSARRSGRCSASRCALPESQLRLLVACGAAGGISATFNAPIAGVFFALELILRNFETRVLRARRAQLGHRRRDRPRGIRQPPVPDAAGVHLHLAAGAACSTRGLGVLAAGVGVGVHRACSTPARTSPTGCGAGPNWLRPAAGGVLLGLLLLAVPQMYGVGYPVLERAVAGTT